MGIVDLSSNKLKEAMVAVLEPLDIPERGDYETTIDDIPGIIIVVRKPEFRGRAAVFIYQLVLKKSLVGKKMVKGENGMPVMVRKLVDYPPLQRACCEAANKKVENSLVNKPVEDEVKFEFLFLKKAVISAKTWLRSLKPNKHTKALKE